MKPRQHFQSGKRSEWQFATLLGPGKRTPPSPPKNSFFLSFPKEIWYLVGSVFRGEPKWKIGRSEAPFSQVAVKCAQLIYVTFVLEICCSSFLSVITASFSPSRNNDRDPFRTSRGTCFSSLGSWDAEYESPQSAASNLLLELQLQQRLHHSEGSHPCRP